MARVARKEIFSPDEVATVHVTNRCVRGEYLMGYDKKTGKDHSHRKRWFRRGSKLAARYFGIDLIEHAIMDNHFHMILRSRPDIVKCWSDKEAARRWLLLYPKRRKKDGTPKVPTKAEIKALVNNKEKLAEIRRRLSNISWFVRKICQSIAQRANLEGPGWGKFWDTRFKSILLLDAEAVLACSLYINLNPIRAVMVYELEKSRFASVQARVRDMLASLKQAEGQAAEAGQLDDSLPEDDAVRAQREEDRRLVEAVLAGNYESLEKQERNDSAYPAPRAELEVKRPGSVQELADMLTTRLEEMCQANARQLDAEDDDDDDEDEDEDEDDEAAHERESPEITRLRGEPPEPWRLGGYLAPFSVNPSHIPSLAYPSRSHQRCSDRGYLEMSFGHYLEILDWCARQIRKDKRGFTPADTPPLIKRLGISEEAWLELVNNFGELFSVVAGMPASIEAHQAARGRRFHLPQATRAMLTPETPESSEAAGSSDQRPTKGELALAVQSPGSSGSPGSPPGKRAKPASP